MLPGTSRSSVLRTVISPDRIAGEAGPSTATAKAAEHGGRTVHPKYRWISSVRAAQRLGLSIRDLYRLIDHGDLPAYRIASEIRLLAHEVEDFHDKFPRPRDLL